MLDHGMWQALVGLTLAALAVMGSPGPSTISVTAIAVTHGVRRALPYAAGTTLGTVAVLLAVAAGLAAALTAAPALGPALGVVAAAYILYLAWRIATAPPLHVGAEDAPPPRFAGGFLLGVANPKAYLAIGAVFAGAPTLSPPLRITVLVAIIAVIHLAWLVAGGVLAGLFRSPRAARILNLAFAALLVLTTVPLLL